MGIKKAVSKDNAIETQIWVTMIAYLLLRVMQHKAKSRLAFSNKF